MHKTLVSISFCIACLVTHVNAQPGSPPSDALKEHVVIAVAPDGSQLAIARSSRQILERNGRVELWDLNTGTLRHTVTGFDGPISNVFFDRESKNVITTSLEYRQSKIRAKAGDRSGRMSIELKWWDARTGEFIRKTTLTGPIDLETLISPDRSTIAVVKRRIESGINSIHVEGPGAGYDIIRRVSGKRSFLESFEIRLFDIKTGKGEQKMSGQAASISYPWVMYFVPPAFSPDGRLFAVAAAREVKVWDVMTGDKLPTIKKFDGNPIAITFSPDSQTIAVSSGEVSEIDRTTIYDSQISVWEVSTAKLTRNLRVKNDFVASLKFAPSGKALLFGTLQYETERKVGTVKVWDFVSDRLATFNVHDDEKVSSLQLLPGKLELVLQSGENVEIRDTKTWRVRQWFEANPEARATRGANRFVLTMKQVTAIGFSSDGITVSGVIPEEGLRIWDSRTGGVKPVQDVETANGLVARSANGKILGEATAQEIKLWDLSTGASRNLPRASSTPVSAFALSYEGSLLAFAEGPQIKLSSATDQSSLRSFNGHESTVEQLTFSTDGRTLVSADESGIIKTWDIVTGQLRQSISTGNIVTAVAVDPTGQLLASAGADYLVSVWNAGTGALQLRLKKHDNVVNALSFSPDGKTLASGGDDRMAVLWDVVAGKSKHTLKGHDLTVTSLAFSPDGQLLATGSGNASLVLWNVNNGKLERVFR